MFDHSHKSYVLSCGIVYHTVQGRSSFQSKSVDCGKNPRGRGRGLTSYSGLYEEPPSEMVTFFRLSVYEKVGISRLKDKENIHLFKYFKGCFKIARLELLKNRFEQRCRFLLWECERGTFFHRRYIKGRGTFFVKNGVWNGKSLNVGAVPPPLSPYRRFSSNSPPPFPVMKPQRVTI